MENPGRTLRNLGEAWEPLQARTGGGDAAAVGDVYVPARRERRERREGAAAPGGRACTGRTEDAYVPPASRRAGLGQQRGSGTRGRRSDAERPAADYCGKVGPCMLA